MRSSTCWWMSGMLSVMFRKILVAARTTAVLVCCSRSSRTFMMSKTSSSDSGVYFRMSSSTKHWAHSLKFLSRFSRAYTTCLVG